MPCTRLTSIERWQASGQAELLEHGFVDGHVAFSVCCVCRGTTGHSTHTRQMG